MYFFNLLLVLGFVFVITAQSCEQEQGSIVLCSGINSSYINSLSVDMSPYKGITVGSHRVSSLESYVIVPTNYFTGNLSIIALIGNPVVYIAQAYMSYEAGYSFYNSSYYDIAGGVLMLGTTTADTASLTLPSGDLVFSLLDIEINAMPEQASIDPVVFVTAPSTPAPACQSVPGYKIDVVANNDSTITIAALQQGYIYENYFLRMYDPTFYGVSITVEIATTDSRVAIYYIADLLTDISNNGTACCVLGNLAAGTFHSGNCAGIGSTYASTCIVSPPTAITCTHESGYTATVTISPTMVYGC